ncbi:MAG: hypothetical protein IJB94_02760 [Clostridia bacterium]|nr:hypothetical protein [Clostridia bacterium]MBQ4065899.1 hypothetical protein [Clostridia bacterium]MBQ4273877.1 hypothetical protein [Clostridia bacterium]
MVFVSIVEVAILFISAGLIIPQIFLLKKQIKEQHEEHRRENTINYMLTWCDCVKKDTCIAEQVARKLNNDQAISLYKHEAFEVLPQTKKDICKFCSLGKEACAGCCLKDSNVVDGKILTELRWHVITYLNTLETVLIAWDLGIVDRETIEEQFSFLKDATKGSTLSQFRYSAGGYPVIEKFIDSIKEHSNDSKSEL